jgi:Spy/CpxP family protein refolding chaperone
MMGFLPMAAVQLDLSDTQKAQIQGIAQSHADEWKTLVDRQQQARRALDASINAAQFDEVLIRQHSAELAAIDADAAVARARARGEVVQLLTPDQQAKLKTLESRATAREGGPGRRGPRA